MLNYNNSTSKMKKEELKTGENAVRTAEGVESIDGFIIRAKEELERHRYAADILSSIRERIEQLMMECSSDEDAICLMIFRDCYVGRLDDEPGSGSGMKEIRAA